MADYDISDIIEYRDFDGMIRSLEVLGRFTSDTLPAHIAERGPGFIGYFPETRADDPRCNRWAYDRQFIQIVASNHAVTRNG